MALTDMTGGLLPTLNDAMPHRLVPVLREFLAEHAGADDASVLVADYELRELRRLNARPGEALTLPVEGTDAGQSFIGQVIVPEPGPGGAVLMWVPLSLRAERLASGFHEGRGSCVSLN